MNNKGQTLVIFVLILPIVLLLIAFLFLKLYSANEKNNQKDIINIMCNSYRNKTTHQELIKIGNMNDINQKIDIHEVNDTIEITLIKKGIFNIKIKTIKMC